MPDLMSTGLTGLLAFQKALDTTSHNIANVNTDGYSRQRVELGTRPATPLGDGWVGNGVASLTVRRQIDDYLVAQSRGSGSLVEGLAAFAAQAERVNNLLGDSSSGLSATVQRVASSVEGVAAEPSSIAARQVLLGELRGAVDRLRFFDAQLRQFDGDVGKKLGGELGEVNTLAQGIARLNGEIVRGFAVTGGQPPNDLLDERDRLLDRLSSKVAISTVTQDGGIVNVFVGNGQPLVVAESARSLSLGVDRFDPARPVVLAQGGQGAVDITGSISGGTLGGLLDVRRQLIDPVRNQLGLVAVGLASSLNDQHRLGMDLTGAAGGELLAVGSAAALASAANTGGASVSVARADLGALSGADYELRWSGSAWSLRRTDTGATVAMTGNGTTVDPLRADGLAIVVSGAAAGGDSFLVRPVREAPTGLALQVTDPARIAAAVPIRAEAALGNAGAATISGGEVLDPSNAQLRQPVALRFLTPATYSVNGAGSFAYTGGQPIEINGWRATISGTPAAGDRFDVTDNGAGVGDNRNAAAMSAALSSNVFNGGTTSVAGVVGQLTSDVGVATRQSQVNRDAQQAMYDDAVRQRANASGVNLDEEAANLLRYQQAYQAAAQLIRISGQLFDTLLNATGR
jgi:flagellar hook-associated protein 1 FlgK